MKGLQPIELMPRTAWVRPWGVVALAVVLPWVVWSGWQVERLRADLAREREGTLALVQRLTRPPAPMSAEDRARHAQIERAAGHLAAPWDRWLSALEQHANGQAVLRHIEHDGATGALKVSARSADVVSMLRYVSALQQDPRFLEVELQRHEVQKSEPGQPVQFELVMRTEPALSAPAATAGERSTGGQP